MPRCSWRGWRTPISRPHGPFDAVAFNFTHDVLQSEKALANIFAACRPGARVAVAGSKLLPWYLAPFNAYVRWNNAPYMTTFAGLCASRGTGSRATCRTSRSRPAMLGACYVAKWTRARLSVRQRRGVAFCSGRRIGYSVNAISDTSAPGRRTLESWRAW